MTRMADRSNHFVFPFISLNLAYGIFVISTLECRFVRGMELQYPQYVCVCHGILRGKRSNILYLELILGFSRHDYVGQGYYVKGRLHI